MPPPSKFNPRLLFHSFPSSQALLPLLLAATAILSCSAGRVPGNGVIRNGALKRDVNGEEMDAHDGNVVQWAPGQAYYMYRFVMTRVASASPVLFRARAYGYVSRKKKR